MLVAKKIVNGVLESNTYLLYKNGDVISECWLIDIGDFPKVITNLPERAMIKGLFITHTHFDHIYGINELIRVFPECNVYTSKYGVEAIYSDKKNFSLYHESPILYSGNMPIILSEGESINLFDDERMYVYETPGHCPSCLTYIVDNYIFTGDSYIPNVPVVSKLPLGDKKLADESEIRIKCLARNKIVCAGHGPIVK